MTAKFDLNARQVPSLEFAEFEFGERMPIPNAVRRHRQVYNPQAYLEVDLSRDKVTISLLTIPQQELIIHVMSRLAYAANAIHTRLERYKEQLETLGSDDQVDIQRNMAQDLKLVEALCQRYLKEVHDIHSLPENSLTRNFRRLIDEILPQRFESLKGIDSSRKERLKTHAKLLTTWHLICDGLGAVSAFIGLRALLSDIGDGSLPGLEKTIDAMRRIERRNIAYGLYNLNCLAQENYFATVSTVIREFHEVRPVLEEMRKETFARWEKFPADIDREELQDRAAKHVRGWIWRLMGKRYSEILTFRDIA